MFKLAAWMPGTEMFAAERTADGAQGVYDALTGIFSPVNVKHFIASATSKHYYEPIAPVVIGTKEDAIAVIQKLKSHGSYHGS